MDEKQERDLRITTWNVNGIRNPFGYQPWRQERTFEAMFDILQADIVIMQETKIQRKDLLDDMVLVPGWDVYFSLPKHKKGYSGVAIYTRNAVCAPIRAEEGITGVLTPPNSSTSFFDLPKDQQIGGYPTISQLSETSLDAATLDSEGRCVILEFPAFVLIGTYCPANRDESRDEFRIGFLNALDARVRNLVAAGKRVFLTGDLNIIRDEMDTAKAEEHLKKEGITIEEYISTPARRMFNQLVVGGKVIGERDEGREHPILVDICRSFHPTRKGMFTCWEQKINARPGNFGSRIDYVLCSEDWKHWFSESDIQEGLMGSDHCPVYAVLKAKVDIDGKEVDIRDLMSDGLFTDGIRAREWSPKDLLPMSAKLIPEFDRRRTIKDMFKRKIPLKALENASFDAHKVTSEMVNLPGEGASTIPRQSIPAANQQQGRTMVENYQDVTPELVLGPGSPASQQSVQNPSSKRSADNPLPRSQKRGKAIKVGAGGKGLPEKGQSSLKGFFKSKQSPQDGSGNSQPSPDMVTKAELSYEIIASADSTPSKPVPIANQKSVETSPSVPFNPDDQVDVIDPIVTKESWSKLLGKRVVPRCEHGEPCISLLTKKPGPNCGRSFYICPRPIGPSGQKEKKSQWRCGTFIWSSDWTGESS